MDSTTLTERCHDWNQNLSIDAQQRLVQNVALTGLKSRNGYSYSESSLRDAVHLYEGKPVFLDHAPDHSRPHDRSTRDLVGSVTNTTFAEGRIRGDIRVLDTESGQTFLKLLEIDSPGVGMSHVVRARRSTDGTSVEQIADVISVDAVINPATTSMFRESTEIESDQNRNVSQDANDHDRPQLQEQLRTLREEQLLLQQRNTELNARVASLQSQNQVHELLAEAKLPDQAVTDFFVKQLESASDEQTRRLLIGDRLAIISQQRPDRPIAQSQERLAISESTQGDDIFIEAIRQK